MNILICYISNSGSTYLIGRTITTILQKAGHQVSFKKTTETQSSELFSADLTILGSPSWDYINENKKRLEGQPHETMIQLLSDAKNQSSPNHKFAVFGPGDNSYTMFCGAVDYMEQFVKDIQGQLVTDSLRIDSYYFDQKNNDAKVTSWADYLATLLT